MSDTAKRSYPARRLRLPTRNWAPTPQVQSAPSPLARAPSDGIFTSVIQFTAPTREYVHRSDREEAERGQRRAVDAGVDLLAGNPVAAGTEIDAIAFDCKPVERAPAGDQPVRRRVGIVVNVRAIDALIEMHTGLSDAAASVNAVVRGPRRPGKRGCCDRHDCAG